MFSKKSEKVHSQRKAATNIYMKEVKPNLSEKDGFTHVVMVNSFSKWINQNFGCEDKYTRQIDQIILLMQHDSYEILDVKFNSVKDQGIAGIMEGFHTLITYK